MSNVVCYDTEVTSAAEEVSVALDRLAARQNRRQYSASNVSSDIMSSASATQCSTAGQTGDSENTAGQPCKPKRVQSAQVWARRSSATAGRRKEIETSDCEESTDSKRDPKHVRGSEHRLRQSSAARSPEVINPAEDCEDLENPKRDHHRPRRSSVAGHRRTDADGLTSDAASVNYYENQRSMIEQSRALLEQSKAKHHALVAQAHSMQKQLRSHQLSEMEVRRSACQTTLAPKPPSAPPADKKPTSTFRTQRLARYVDRYHN